MKIVNQNLYESKFIKRSFKHLLKHQPDILTVQELRLGRFNRLQNDFEPLKGYKALIPNTKLKKYPALFTRKKVINWGELYFNEFTQGLSSSDLSKEKYLSMVLWADIVIKGETIRIYNCHIYLKKLGFLKRVSILSQIYKHAKDSEKIILIGDMNTTIPQGKFFRFITNLKLKSVMPLFAEVGDFYNKNEKYFFSYFINKLGLSDALDLNHNTWRLPYMPVDIFGLKLDWVLHKNLNVNAYVLDKTPFYLDHKTVVALVN